MTPVQVEWEGPHDWRTVIDQKRDLTHDCGLYQIVGNHRVHGARTLLYVGKTDRRTFADRITEHTWWLKHERDVEVYLGRIRDDDTSPDPDWRRWKTLLGHVEALTIYWHSPPYNSHYIARYSGPPLAINATGKFGRLLPSYTTDWSKPVLDSLPTYRLVASFVVDGTPHGYPGGPGAWRESCRDKARTSIGGLPLPATTPVKIVARFNFHSTSRSWDLDNALKSLIDAIGAAGLCRPPTTGGATTEWNTDDSIVYRVEAEKAQTTENPSTEVAIWLAHDTVDRQS